MMVVAAKCPNGHVLRASNDLLGRTVNCPQCDVSFVIQDSQDATALERVPLGNSEIDLASEDWEPVERGHIETVNSTPSAYQPRYRQREVPKEPKAWNSALLFGGLGGLGGVLLVGCIGLALFWVLGKSTGPNEQAASHPRKASPKQLASSNQSDFDREPPGASIVSGNQALAETSNPSKVPAKESEFAKNSSGNDQLRNIFGYDKQRRDQLSAYLQLKGHSRGKIGVLNFKILGRLSGLCKKLHLRADANNNVEFPERAFPEYRSMFESRTLFAEGKRGDLLPDLLQDLRADYEADKLNASDKQLAYIVFSAFLLDTL